MIKKEIFFFFQAEDGIRDSPVTGVQTCALPILTRKKMAAEIIKVVDAVSEAKDVDREIIFQAIENALESATKKKYAENMDVKVDIDRETGDYKTYRQWLVFADESDRKSVV